jgi:hypothetical protein
MGLQVQQAHKVFKVVQDQLVQMESKDLLEHKDNKEQLALLEQQALQELKDKQAQRALQVRQDYKAYKE